MATKVTFDPVNKIIQVTLAPTSGIVNLDVKTDIYSDGKEDWLSSSTLSKYRFPIRVVGGNSLPGNRSLGSTFFLQYGWKIRAYGSDHTLNINGNLYSEDGSSPYTSVLGSFNVSIINLVSSIVDSISTTGGGSVDSTAISSAVWANSKALTLGKFLGLK